MGVAGAQVYQACSYSYRFSVASIGIFEAVLGSWGTVLLPYHHTVDGCEILHQLIDGLSHYSQGFNHPFGDAGFRNHPQ